MRQAATVILVMTAAANASAALPVVKLEEVKSPTLLFADPARPGVFLEAPSILTDVDLDVRGVLLRGEARQRFTNDTGQPLEGVYVFPLSEGAAVDTLTMVIGDRVVEGQIHEKGQAVQIFEAAKAEGKRASLVVEQRPNVFTNAVANIGPGETIEVDIGWQEVLRYDAGKVSLRFPLIVAPRYSPGGPADTPLEQTLAPSSRAQISAHVQAGFPVASMQSLYHQVDATPQPRDTFDVALRGVVPADRDFVLEWTAKPLLAPTAAVFTEQRGDERYGLLLVVPPTSVDEEPVSVPRETIFVIDTSGSMGGQSIEQARQALIMGLGTLSPRDSFNIVQFNSYASKLFDEAVPASKDKIAEATRWIERLQADGGTEMLLALQEALPNGVHDKESLRQVVFMTDGSVTNEQELFNFIQSHLGSSRLFTVGIGSAPNSYFMKKAAEFGRGTFTYIGATNEVRTKMSELFGKIESPVLANIDVQWGKGDVEMWPSRIPDLYAGEPLVVAVRAPSLDQHVVVSGRVAGKPWSAKIELPVPVREPGVSKLWAKRKIDSIIDADNGSEAHRSDVVHLALNHHLVTKYTSLVAVDVTPVAPREDQSLISAAPMNGPPGSLPKGGTGSTLSMILGALILAFALYMRRESECAR